ncbi:hypothetical protein HYALB_00013046 [Hymenoscyphus albidus]|uniref:Uncharacterized protein n=1 Tax=Hymenoscyphus albidus TaxID=595503 RepID=A0A9N9LVN0_9HELO|nr:hypothetical protein HYALB_00013046 [Hymenoscyphus albidus]
MEAFNKRFDSNVDLFQKLSKVRVRTTVRELNEQFPGGPHEGMTLKELNGIEESLRRIEKNMAILGKFAKDDLEKDHPGLALRVRNALFKLAAIKSWIKEYSSTDPETPDQNKRTVRRHPLSFENIPSRSWKDSSGPRSATGPPQFRLAQMTTEDTIPNPVDRTGRGTSGESQPWAPQGYYGAASSFVSQVPYRATRVPDDPAAAEDTPTAKPAGLHRLLRRASNASNSAALNAMARSLGLRSEGDVSAEMILNS